MSSQKESRSTVCPTGFSKQLIVYFLFSFLLGFVTPVAWATQNSVVVGEKNNEFSPGYEKRQESSP